MEGSRYQWLGQMLAALGVIASLCLVAYEMKLSRDIAIADIYQQRTAMDISLALHELPSEQVAAATGKFAEGEEALSRYEVALLLFTADAWVMSKENVYFQYQLGLLDEMEWTVHRFNLKGFVDTPCYREYFARKKRGFRDDFAAEVEALLSELPASDCVLY